MMARFMALCFVLGVYLGGTCANFLRADQKDTFTCPPDTVGFYPEGLGCSQNYYYCNYGELYPLQCLCSSEGNCTVYDYYDQLCVDPQDCTPLTTTSTAPPSTMSTMQATTSSTLLPTTTLPSTTLRPFNCPYDGFFPVPQSCTNKYYVCVSGVALDQSCPENTIFDPVTYKCTPAEEASCQKPFDCPPANGYYPYSPDACSSVYFICVNGMGTIQYCPQNSVYIPDVGVCVPAGQQPPCTPGGTYTPSTTIQSTTVTSTTQQPTTTTSTTQQPITTSTTQPTTTTSTTQQTTTASTTQQTTTASTTQPTTTTSTTQPTTTASTTQQTTTTTTTEPTTTTTTTEPTTTTTTTEPTTTKDPNLFVCPQANGTFPYPGNCTLYWECTEYVALLKQCGKDLGFNPNTGRCELAITLPSCYARSYFRFEESVNKDFVCPTSVGNYPLNVHRCASTYVSCDSGIPFNRSCPDDKVFDPLQMMCIPRQYSTCNEKRAKLAKIFA